jgi:hypothetical protein
MPSEWPTHEEIENCIRQASEARSMYLAELISRGIDATGHLARKPLAIGATALAVLIGGVLVQAESGSSGFATACVEREAALITAAGARDDGDATAALAQSGPELMTARNECHEGKVKEAVALYDELIRQMAALSQSRTMDTAE